MRRLVTLFRRIHLAVLKHELVGLQTYYDENIRHDVSTSDAVDYRYRERLALAQRRREQAQVDLFVAELRQ